MKGRAPEAAALITAETREGEGVERPARCAGQGEDYGAQAIWETCAARSCGAFKPP